MNFNKYRVDPIYREKKKQLSREYYRNKIIKQNAEISKEFNITNEKTTLYFTMEEEIRNNNFWEDFNKKAREELKKLNMIN